MAFKQIMAVNVSAVVISSQHYSPESEVDGKLDVGTI